MSDSASNATKKTAVIVTKDISDEWMEGFTIAAEDSEGELDISLEATMDVMYPGLDDVYNTVHRRYNPAEYPVGTVVARIQPDGAVDWPLDDEQEAGNDG